MDISEIQNIMASELAKQDEQDALLNAYYIISLKIIKKIFKKAALADAKALNTLKAVTYAKSRLTFFLALTEPQQALTAQKVVEAVVLHDVELEVRNYYYDNFEFFVAQEAVRYTREQVLAARDTVAENVEKYHDQLKNLTEPSFLLSDFQKMDRIFSFVQKAILGPEVFPIYVEEFNQALAILILYQTKFQREATTPYTLH